MRRSREVIDGARRARSRDAPFLLAPGAGRDADATRELARTLRARSAPTLAAHGASRRATSSSYMLPNGVAAASVFLGAMTAATSSSPVNLLAQDAQLEYTLGAFASRGSCSRRRSSRAPARRCVARRRAAARSSTSTLDAARRCRRGRRARRAARVAADDAGDADVHVGHDRRAEGRAAVAREHAPRRARGRAQRTRSTPRDRVLSSLPLYHINGQCIATVAPLVSRRQHRDAAPLQRVAVVAAGRALSADVAQRRADDHRVPAQRPGPDAGAARGAAAACASRARRRRRCRPSSIARSRRASAFRSRGDGADRVRVGRVLQSAATRARARSAVAGPAARRARRASSTPDGAVLGDGERGEIEIARRQRDAAATHKDAGADGAQRCAPTAGSRPAISAIATPTASTSSPAG